MTQSLVTVVLFVSLMAMAPWALKRLQQRRGLLAGAMGMPAQGSKLLSAVSIGPQQRVVTVEVGPAGARTQLVLGVTAQSITCLHTLPATEAPARSLDA